MCVAGIRPQFFIDMAPELWQDMPGIDAINLACSGDWFHHEDFKASYRRWHPELLGAAIWQCRRSEVLTASDFLAWSILGQPGGG